ncbi:MAG TPA: patatin-like phospholipase family protein [Bryobacteraceae bacterium]|nr:patatin-like phospholipase family protein [Bryobacteraceae bacterium]
MTALVLSAGGMYGAYQAGAWRAIADIFHPDLVVGASIGAITGWAIAGGCDPDELVDRWLHLDAASRYPWKLPRSPLHGIFDTTALQRAIREIYESFQPRIHYAMVVTDLLKLRPRVIRGNEVSWQHLVASTSIMGLFDQVRLGGRIYSDGGLLSHLPLWAAAEMGATKALVINVIPAPPGNIARIVVGAVRMVSPFRAIVPQGIQVMRLGPPRLLGKPLESIYWTRANAEAWIRAGEEQASGLKHSIANCFERE